MVTKYYYNGREISYSEKLIIEAKEFRKALKVKKSSPTVLTVDVDEDLDECLEGAWQNMMF